MVNKIDCVTLSCDNCGTTFQDEEHTGFSIFVDESSAWEYADNNNWIKESGKHYCPSCYLYDDADKLIIVDNPFNKQPA